MLLIAASFPKYRNHLGSGQAVSTIGGRDRHLGARSAKASKLDCDRLIFEWLDSERTQAVAAQVLCWG